MGDTDIKIQEIADELKVTISVVVSLLSQAFAHSVKLGDEVLCDLNEAKKNVKGGKALMAKVLKEATKRGLMEHREYYVFLHGESSDSLRDYWQLDLDAEYGIDVFTGANAGAFLSMEETYRERMAKAIEEAWLPDMVQAMADLYAEDYARRNDGRAPTARNVYLSVHEPLIAYQQEFSRYQLQYGMNAAIRNGVGNPRYAYKVAKGAPGGQPSEPVLSGPVKTFKTDDGRTCGQLDKWALQHPKYREMYIECFGPQDE
jgi:hypothetical protein